MNAPLLLFVVQLAAFWSVWRWYVARLGDSGDELWGLLALATVAVFAVRSKLTAAEDKSSREVRAEVGSSDNERSLLPAIALMLIYAATYPFAPPLVRACIAMIAIGVALSRLRFGTSAHIGVLGLLLLALPLMPSLQFYGGYPLRVFVAGASAPLLRMSGFAVEAEGTCLDWAGRLIWVDAPCGGVRMLWAGLYLTCTLLCLYEHHVRGSLAALAASVLLILAGNVMRAVALFYVEARVFDLPSWTHEATGIVAFAFVAAGITATLQWLRRTRVCDSASAF